MSGRLSGKIALVTGSANGIGAGCARIFAEQGATVIGVDLAECDVTDEAAISRLMEGAAHGIRANSIAPGFIQTAATKAHLDTDPGFRDTVLARNMIKRLGTPEDVAHCALWLASDEAGYVTGADIAVDAGATAW